MEAQGVEPGPELLGPDPPALLHWVLQHFVAIAKTRHEGMGPNRLTYAEIIAYQEAMWVRLYPLHIRLILDIDAIYLECWSEAHMPAQQPQAVDGKGKPKPKLGKPVPFMLPEGLTMEPPRKKLDG